MCNYPYLLHTLSHVYDRKFETTTAVKHRGINAVQCAPYRHCGHISKEPSKGHAEKNISRPHEIKFRSHELHGECRGLITESLEIIFTDMRQKRDSQQPRYTHHLRLPKKPAQQPHHFSAHVCCGQTAGWIKMPLGMEVSAQATFLDVDPAPPSHAKGHNSLILFRPMSTVAKKGRPSQQLLSSCCTADGRESIYFTMGRHVCPAMKSSRTCLSSTHASRQNFSVLVLVLEPFLPLLGSVSQFLSRGHGSAL